MHEKPWQPSTADWCATAGTLKTVVTESLQRKIKIWLKLNKAINEEWKWPFQDGRQNFGKTFFSFATDLVDLVPSFPQMKRPLAAAWFMSKVQSCKHWAWRMMFIDLQAQWPLPGSQTFCFLISSHPKVKNFPFLLEPCLFTAYTVFLT